METTARFDAETEFHRCTPMVTRIAKQVASRVPANVTLDDLVQVGLVGLLEASRRFDPAEGVPFEAFATLRIRGAMTDELRSHDWMPRARRRDLRQVEEARSRLAQRLGRRPTEPEIAAELGVALEDVQGTLADGDMGRPCVADGIDDDEPVAAERLEDPSADPLKHCFDGRFRADLARAIAKLPERERLVMGLYYEQDLTLREIAAVLDVTESRVCQIHRQAVERLQDALAGWREAAPKAAPRARRHAA